MGQSLKSLQELYLNRKYSEAVDLLKNSKAELSPGLYHYNLGSIYAKKGELPLARFHLEMSKALNFSPTKVENNLKFVKENLGVSRIELPHSTTEYLRASLESLSTQWYVSLFLFSVLIGLFLFKKTHKVLLMLVFLILGMTPYILSRKYSGSLGVAVVKGQSSLFEGPSSVFEQSGELPGGLKIYLSKLREENWYFIEYPESFRGWVQEKDLNFIKRL